jgi:hypothetical protein
MVLDFRQKFDRTEVLTRLTTTSYEEAEDEAESETQICRSTRDRSDRRRSRRRRSRKNRNTTEEEEEDRVDSSST